MLHNPFEFTVSKTIIPLLKIFLGHSSILSSVYQKFLFLAYNSQNQKNFKNKKIIYK